MECCRDISLKLCYDDYLAFACLLLLSLVRQAALETVTGVVITIFHYCVPVMEPTANCTYKHFSPHL